MKLSILSLLPASAVLVGTASAAPAESSTSQMPDSFPSADKEAYRTIALWQLEYNGRVLKSLAGKKTGCTIDKLTYRREWNSLSGDERKAYTRAVRCLQSQTPPVVNASVPGSRSKYDDFVASHINQAPFVHFSGLFLHWHRYFTWLYENQLREKCGYTGGQPYWDWSLTYQDPRKSAVFDGSDTSMGGNGEGVGPQLPIDQTPLNGTVAALNPPIPGQNCVTKGPFKDYVVDLGPNIYPPFGPDGGLGYNPRCLSRNISLWWANNTRATDVTSLFAFAGGNLSNFDLQLEQFQPKPGVHTSGHVQIGGDPSSDPIASPGEPVFYLHHSQIDRIWTLWQSRDFAARVPQTYGTQTAFNQPPSLPVTPDTTLHYPFLDTDKRLGDLSSATGGPFCYLYV